MWAKRVHQNQISNYNSQIRHLKLKSTYIKNLIFNLLFSKFYKIFTPSFSSGNSNISIFLEIKVALASP